jgi:hypothetical protein
MMMKTLKNLSIALIIAILCNTNTVFGQQTVQDVIKSELEDLLIRGNVLNSAEQNKELAEITGRAKKKIAQEKIKSDERLRKKILENYPYPQDGKTKMINPDLQFKGVNLSYIGSYLINDFSSVRTNSFPENSNDPDLPWLLSNAQVGLTNPNRNNYNLFSDLTYLVSLDAEMGLGTENPYFDNKAKTAIFKSQQNNQTLSIAYGTFNNQLASVFRRAKLKSQFSELEMAPLLNLWLLYSKNEISGNEFVLNSFEALSIYRTSRVSMMNKTDFTNEMSVNISTIPFLNLNGSSNLNWSRERKSTISENSYDLYMMAPPTFQKIPSITEIVSIWNTFSVPSTMYTEGTNSLLISKNNEQNKVKIIFGPVSPEFFKRVQPDVNALKDNLRNNFISDVQVSEIIPYSSLPGYYIYELKFIRNENFYSNLNLASPTINENIKIKLICLDKINENELSRSYDLILQTETLPIPTIDISSVKLDDNILNTYKFKMLTGFQSNGNINSATISKITIRDENYKAFEVALNKNNYQGVRKTPNVYEFNLESDIDHKTFNRSSIITATITMDIVENGISFKRELSMRLPYQYPSELLTSKESSVLIFESGKELISMLPDSLVLDNNKMLKDFLMESSSQDSLTTITKAFESLNTSDKEKIKFLPTGYFQVNIELLDMNKIKE